MFLKLEDKALMSMARLQSNNDFDEVIKWFNSMLLTQDKQNRVLKDQQLHQGQGTAQVLAHILEQAETSKEVAVRMKNMNI